MEMILERIVIRNFMSHKRTEINFNMGVTAFIGPNGAGKSSILDAIYYALYGKSARETIPNLIKKGKRYCQVELTFRCGGKRYHVIRSHSLLGSKTTANLFEILENGKRKLIAREPTTVTKEIESIIGLNHKVFLQVIYVRQGELERIILEPRAKRKEFMSKILGIEDLQKAYENMRDIINDFERELERIKGEIKQKEERKEELKKVKKELKNVEKRRQTLLEELSKIKTSLTEVKTQLANLEKQKIRFEHFKAKLEKCESDLTALENKLDTLRKELVKCEDARKRMKEIEDKVKLHDKLAEAASKYYERDAVKSELLDLENDYKRYTLLKDTLAQLEKYYNEYQTVEENIEKIEHTLESYAEYYHELQNLEKEKNTIRRELNEYLREVNAFKKLLEEKLKVEIKHDEMGRLIGDTKARIEEIIDGKKREINNLREDLSSHIAVIDDRKKKIEELKKVRVKCPLCGQLLTESHRIKVIRDLMEEVREHKLEKMKIESLIQKLEKDLEYYEKEKTSLTELWNSYYNEIHPKLNVIRKLREKLQDMAERYTFLQEMTKEYLRSKQMLDNLRKKRRELERYVTEYNKVCAELEALEGKHGPPDNLRLNIELKKAKLRTLEDEIAEIESNLGVHFEHGEEVRLKLNELSMFKSEYEELKSDFERLRVIEGQLQNLVEQREKLKLEIQRLRDFMKKIQYNPKEHESVREKHDKLHALVGQYEGELKSLREQAIKLKQQISNLREKLKKLEAKEKYARRLDKFIKLLERLRSLYGKDGLQKVIREKAVKSIATLTSRYLEKFGLGISNVGFDENFDIKVYSSFYSEAIPVKNLSGGEIIAIALAFRFALAKVIAGDRVEMLILDEPTTFLDETRRRDLVNIIRDVFMTVERMLPQLIIVTHNRELEEAATTVYFVNKDATGTSRVTLQEEAKI
ncbi:hypothetical protein DRO02_04255 [archaeon]|nr:MAG: hypothetical protein DRO02_04255 [archaeon]